MKIINSTVQKGFFGRITEGRFSSIFGPVQAIPAMY
jgi:hypothetical protein